MSSACNRRRHWPECVGRVNRTFCFTGASYRAQLLKGRLVLNPGFFFFLQKHFFAGADLGKGAGGVHPPPPPRDDLRFSNKTGILQKKKTMWFIGVEVEQETSAPPPKKNPGSAPAECVGRVNRTFVQRPISA